MYTYLKSKSMLKLSLLLKCYSFQKQHKYNILFSPIVSYDYYLTNYKLPEVRNWTCIRQTSNKWANDCLFSIFSITNNIISEKIK